MLGTSSALSVVLGKFRKMSYDMQQVLDFLRDIKENNNVEWMHANRSRYEKARDTFKALSQEILTRMQAIDPQLHGLEVKNCIFRFNRDTRFSLDKAPYKRHFGVYYVPGGKKAVGAGYYLHIQPFDSADEMFGQSLIDFGLYMPPTKAAKIIREEIYYGAGERMRQFLGRSDVAGKFQFYSDDLLKVLPKNLKDSPYDELIRHKNWDMFQTLSDDQILAPDFVDYVVDRFATGMEWNHILNEMLDGYEN